MSAAVAQAIRGMMAAGFTLDQALLAIEKMDEAKRASAKTNAERQAAWRLRQKAVTSNESNVTAVTDPATTTALALAELEPKNLENSYLKTPLKGVKKGKVLATIEKPKSVNAECLTELGKVLDAGHAQAVLDHRNRMRKPMTPHAASLLASSLAEAPDPNAAADEMIERGWQSWKASWGRNSHGPPGRIRENSLLTGMEEFEQRFGNNVQQFPRIAG